jgi:hypothetical protein
MQKTHQLDLPFSSGKFYTLPKSLPGRVNVDDYVFFRWPASVNPSDYVIVIETLDTSQPSHLRQIGPLRPNVELPHVHYDAYAKIVVMPKNDPNKHIWYARLSRGSSYELSEPHDAIHVRGTTHEMYRSGVLNSGCDVSNLAY